MHSNDIPGHDMRSTESPTQVEPAQEQDIPIMAESAAALRGRVIDLAWPVIGENLLETLLGVVDTALVAGLGTAAIAGVGSGLQIMFFLLAALAALSVGSSILVAQAVGAGDNVQASRVARQSILWSLILSIPLAVVGFILSRPLIGLFGMAPGVAKIGVGYLQVTMGTVVVLVALIIGGGVLRGAGDSRTPMIVTAIANVIHGILAYGLIYGRLGLPALGPVGSAWATFIARSIALVLLLRQLRKGRSGVTIAGRLGWRPDWSVAKKVLSLGIPASVEQLLMASGFLVMTIMVARLGTDTLAAMRISITALSLSFLPGIGFSVAATALVGQSIGARQPDVGSRIARIATLWAVIWMGTVGFLIFVFASPIMRLFTALPAVILIGAQGLRIVAITQPFWAVGMVQTGAIRGSGDTRFPSVLGASGIWSTVLLVWVALHTFGGGLVTVWGGFLVTSPITATLAWRRLRSRLTGMAENPIEDGLAAEAA